MGIWSKVALGVTVVFFIVFFNTCQACALPGALGWIFSSLHVSIGFAITGVVWANTWLPSCRSSEPW